MRTEKSISTTKNIAMEKLRSIKCTNEIGK